jgi:hypothetical protein
VNILGHVGHKKPWVLTGIGNQKASKASGKKSASRPRGDQMIGIDGANVLSKLCVPLGDDGRHAGTGSGDGRAAAWIIG